MKDRHTDPAVQAAAQVLFEAMRELVKEAVHEAMADRMSFVAEVKKRVEDQPEAKPPSRQTLIRMPELKRLTGMSPRIIYRSMADGNFPKPLRLGERAVAWWWGEIEDWLASRPRSTLRAMSHRKKP